MRGHPLAVSIDYPAAGIVWQQGNTVVKTALTTYTVNGITVAGGNRDGGNADQFNYPFGVATDGRGKLYVAYMLNHRVQQFSPTFDASCTPAEAGAYLATVTTFSGCAAEAAPVAVTEAVAITAQPEGDAKCAGESVSFSVAATGVNTSNPLRYQWQKDGMDIEGATGATYQIASLKPGDAGNYRVMIGSDCGTIASAVAALTVTTPTATLRSSAAGNRINAGQAITFIAAPASADPESGRDLPHRAGDEQRGDVCKRGVRGFPYLRKCLRHPHGHCHGQLDGRHWGG